MQALVLAAGKGTRMKSECPKVLHEIFGQPMLEIVLDKLAALDVRRPKVVIGYGADRVRKIIGDRVDWVLQLEQKGTGHAVSCAERSLKNFRGDLLIWPGDMPLLKLESLRRFIRAHQAGGYVCSVLSALRIDPAGYGRILRAGGRFYGIREELDATEAERRIQEINTGVYLFNAERLFAVLRKVRPANQKNEYYLTDTIEILSAEQTEIEAFPFSESYEAQGINSRVDLGEVMKNMNRDIIRQHQENGVTFVSPEQTFVASGVRIGPDTVIYPWTYIEAGVRIGKKCQIGPFAKLRKGTVIGDESVVGSFVEVNRSRLGKKVMAKHLTYLGDATIGDGTNIGAGTITANFDGRNKHKTKIGRNVLVGSDTVLVAPVSIGDSAKTGAGAVVTSGTKVKKGEVLVGIPARPMGKFKQNKTAS